MNLFNMLLGPMLKIAMGCTFGSFFGGDEESSGGGAPTVQGSVDYRNADQGRIQGALADWITKYLPQYQPGQTYPGTFTAPMSTYESKGMDYLSKYLNGPDYTEMLPAAKENILGTLTGKFDPMTSDYYKAMREGMQIEQRDASDALDRDLAARNKYFSSERIGAQKDLQLKGSNWMQQLLATMGEQERVRQMKSVPLALTLDQAITQAPVSKVAASQQFGALPRQINQADLSSRFGDWTRARGEWSAIPNIATGFPSGATTSPIMQYPTTGSQGGWWDSWGKDATNAALKAAMTIAFM